jgi:hypothetical protein
MVLFRTLFAKSNFNGNRISRKKARRASSEVEAQMEQRSQSQHARQKSGRDGSLGPSSRADGFSKELLTADTMSPEVFDV